MSAPTAWSGVLKRHPVYAEWSSDWVMIRDFVAGERRVKSKGTKYLPKMTDQSDESYASYKDRAVFFNASRRTIEGLTGLVFRRAPVIDLPTDAQKALAPGLDICTLDGQSFNVFAEQVLSELITTGRFGALVDRYGTGEPYFAGYRAEEITNWRVEIVNGRRVPTQIVLYEVEEAEATDGFGYDENYRYRELTLTPEGYQQRVYSVGGKDEVKRISTATPTRRGDVFNNIPFVFFNPFDLTATVQRSPILDIVNLNVHHYRASADLSHGRHYTAIPTYYMTAPAGKEDVTYAVGPDRVWMLEPDGQAGILEFNGQGLTYLENATVDIERQMAVMGARLLISSRSAGSEAAEVATQRERYEQATLYSILDTAEEGLTRLLHWWLQWQDVDPSGARVKLNRDFSEAKLSYREALNLVRLWHAGVMPRDAVIEALYEGDVGPTRRSVSEWKELLDKPEQRPTPEQLLMKI